ncbi:TetR/AcrR family transcriptional regulator [Paenibacillus sp. GSMTC-2017]|uniref:TetR/AcrR family transcriptional regulator n=1 Tax=Paenibacillus sp. GSMTC-2017 TaxID=2794350 RepID=UPI0018D85ADD|nr:TetR/AcrR family transcriptional regulator [Paenibacillus sp. GSMTC-2017]MBH5318339.1 TetR/AcrR family transcriptional regulator [Paenibacillus sp. GSMTC-2017]
METEIKDIDGRHLRSKLTRQKLLKAARTVFLTDGFQNSTISQVIKLAKTGYGTAYTHFTGKDDLLIVLMEDVMQQFFEIANYSFHPTSKEEARTVIKSQVLTFFQIAESERDMMKVFAEAMGLSQAINLKWEEIRHKQIQSITNDITYSQTNGLARKDLKAELVACQWFYSNEMFQWDIVHNRHTSSLEEIAESMTTMYTDALYL